MDVPQASQSQASAVDDDELEAEKEAEIYAHNEFLVGPEVLDRNWVPTNKLMSAKKGRGRKKTNATSGNNDSKNLIDALLPRGLPRIKEETAVNLADNDVIELGHFRRLPAVDYETVVNAYNLLHFWVRRYIFKDRIPGGVESFRDTLVEDAEDMLTLSSNAATGITGTNLEKFVAHQWSRIKHFDLEVVALTLNKYHSYKFNFNISKHGDMTCTAKETMTGWDMKMTARAVREMRASLEGDLLVSF